MDIRIGFLSAINSNYGSLLQTFALQQILKNNGVKAPILVYAGRPFFVQLKRIFNLSLLRMKIRLLLRQYLSSLWSSQLRANFKIREQKFEEFRTNHLEIIPFYNSREELCKDVDRFKAYLVGSDQLWNPMNIGIDFYTLTFVPKFIFKASYATSFGVSSIPKRQRTQTMTFLEGFQLISTRELAGKSIIKNLIGREVPVVCDPTMLVGREFWESIISTFPLEKEKYIFCYFISSRIDLRELALRIKKATNCIVVSIPHVDEFVKIDLSFSDKALYNIGPLEFVNLIANATYVLTDSFHGTVFSLLFQQRFLVFDRFEDNQKGSMNSRIDSLLSILGASDRRAKVDDDILTKLDNTINWLAIESNINDFRALSNQYFIELVERMKEQYDRSN